MEAYMEFLIAAVATTLVIALVGILVAGGYMIYKFFKDEY